ncbi:RluA family pseudouridine synthase [Azospirillum halopraeferens]|uniref:RluA family pseudouridine synthase n=1 Tax=Azospirillum halopraeferens TaxID=34010 RepID=UPI0004056F72|nr:RNA pseudouridine synthase [Azospirillum halopraeferens]
MLPPFPAPDTPIPPAPLLSDADLRGRILHLDPDVLVLDKPAGLAVHAAHRIEHHLGHYMAALALDAPEPPRLSHRLDRDTAGCLALGRTAYGATRLGKLFAAGRVAKTYWAVAEGVPERPEGIIDHPLLKLKEPGSRGIVPHPDGQPALTEYRVLGSDGSRSWLELTPRTGRTHQLRVHCAAIGCPLVGEPYYGPERRPPGNLHLLARAIAFRLDADRPPVAATAPPPPHMAEALRACGWRA